MRLFLIKRTEMASKYYDMLKESEQDFCILMVEGGSRFAGNPVACYKETIGRDDESEDPGSPYIGFHVAELLKREDIRGCINELRQAHDEEFDREMLVIRLRESLLGIIKECSEIDVYDRRGRLLSPAALRSVANMSVKTLMSLDPKLCNMSGHDGEGGENNVINFNVVVPEKPKKTVEQHIKELECEDGGEQR